MTNSRITAANTWWPTDRKFAKESSRRWLPRLALAIILIGAWSGGVRAQQAPAQAFLEAIYGPYLDKNYPGQNYGDAGRLFAADLARAMNADSAAAKRRGEVPLLDGDPFVCAQDWEIGKLAVSVSAAGARTTGIVTFDNIGKPRRVALDLVQTPAGWRIADIACSDDPNSLRALYKLRP